jgi:mannosyltransferase
MLLALLLRLPFLSSRPVWYDEAFSVLLARRPVPEILAGTAADTMPPAYYVLLRAWLSLGGGVGAWRLLNVLLGVALVGIVYLLAFEIFDRRAAIWAGLLAAVSPLLIYQAQELRMYTLLTLALTVYALCVYRAVASSTRRALAWWVGAALSGAVAMYSHNLAIFSIVAADVYLALRRDGRGLLRLLAAQAAMGVLFLPWLVQVPGQVAKIQAAFWTPRPGVLEIVQGIVFLHASLPVPDPWLPLAVAASLLALILTVYLLFKSGRPGAGSTYLITLAIVPPSLLFVVSYLMRPVFVPRAYMLSLVAYLILAGSVVASARPRPLAWVVAGAFLLSAAVGLPPQYSQATFPRSPFGSMVAELRATQRPGDLILHDNKLSYFPAILYGADLKQAFLPDEPGSHNDTLAPATQLALGLFPSPDAARAVAGAERVRYVVFQRALDEYARTAVGVPPALRWLRDHAVEVGENEFNDLRVIDFDLAP